MDSYDSSISFGKPCQATFVKNYRSVLKNKDVSSAQLFFKMITFFWKTHHRCCSCLKDSGYQETWMARPRGEVLARVWPPRLAQDAKRMEETGMGDDQVQIRTLAGPWPPWLAGSWRGPSLAGRRFRSRSRRPKDWNENGDVLFFCLVVVFVLIVKSWPRCDSRRCDHHSRPSAHAHTPTHTNTHTHTHKHTLVLLQSLTQPLSLSQAHTHTHTRTHTLNLTAS